MAMNINRVARRPQHCECHFDSTAAETSSKSYCTTTRAGQGDAHTAPARNAEEPQEADNAGPRFDLSFLSFERALRVILALPCTPSSINRPPSIRHNQPPNWPRLLHPPQSDGGDPSRRSPVYFSKRTLSMCPSIARDRSSPLQLWEGHECIPRSAPLSSNRFADPPTQSRAANDMPRQAPSSGIVVKVNLAASSYSFHLFLVSRDRSIIRSPWLPVCSGSGMTAALPCSPLRRSTASGTPPGSVPAA